MSWIDSLNEASWIILVCGILILFWVYQPWKWSRKITSKSDDSKSICIDMENCTNVQVSGNTGSGFDTMVRAKNSKNLDITDNSGSKH